jgi:hypothetical protein
MLGNKSNVFLTRLSHVLRPTKSNVKYCILLINILLYYNYKPSKQQKPMNRAKGEMPFKT